MQKDLAESHAKVEQAQVIDYCISLIDREKAE